jgi:hypothetical protein
MRISLLTVIGWSACLVGLVPSQAEETGSDVEARQVQTRAVIKGFQISLQQYFTEYNTWPTATLDEPDKNGWHRTQGKIIETLHGDNPRKITFYDPPVAKGGHAGLSYGELQIPILSDFWDQPLYFILDTKGTGQIPNPDPRDNKEHPFITAPILIFSAGPDHDPTTWDDNVVSWK